MEPKKVCIIGELGSCGKWWKRFFQARSCEMTGFDKDASAEERQRLVREAEVVFFAIPIPVIISMIRELAPFSRPDQLWMDVSGFKSAVMSALLKTQAEVVGLHPLVAPEDQDDLQGEVLVVCPSRVAKWHRWLDNFLFETKGDIHKVNPWDHDRAMLANQNAVHLSAILLAMVIEKLKADPDDVATFRTRFSRQPLRSVATFLPRDPKRSAEIQMSGGIEVINAFVHATEELREMFLNGRNGESEELANQILHSREFFGDAILQKLREC